MRLCSVPVSAQGTVVCSLSMTTVACVSMGASAYSRDCAEPIRLAERSERERNYDDVDKPIGHSADHSTAQPPASITSQSNIITHFRVPKI